MLELWIDLHCFNNWLLPRTPLLSRRPFWGEVSLQACTAMEKVEAPQRECFHSGLRSPLLAKIIMLTIDGLGWLWKAIVDDEKNGVLTSSPAHQWSFQTGGLLSKWWGNNRWSDEEISDCQMRLGENQRWWWATWSNWASSWLCIFSKTRGTATNLNSPLPLFSFFTNHFSLSPKLVKNHHLQIIIRRIIVMYLVGWTSVRVFKREPFKASLSAKWIVPPMLGIIQISQT